MRRKCFDVIYNQNFLILATQSNELKHNWTEKIVPPTNYTNFYQMRVGRNKSLNAACIFCVQGLRYPWLLQVLAYARTITQNETIENDFGRSATTNVEIRRARNTEDGNKQVTELIRKARH